MLPYSSLHRLADFISLSIGRVENVGVLVLLIGVVGHGVGSGTAFIMWWMIW